MMELSGYTINSTLFQAKRFTFYKAHRDVDLCKVILKVSNIANPSLTELATLQHEYRILEQLDLPGIIHVHELIKHQNKLILVLEDFNGELLEEYLKKNGLDLPRFFSIALQLIDIIGELHLQHIIHRDINPENIIIQPDTLRIKLADFTQSSHLLHETLEQIPLKNIESSLAYISPEQTGRINRQIDYRSDFYSLGVTFYEMLTGRVPFEGSDVLELVHSHLAKTPESIHHINSQIPIMLSHIVDKLMAKMPEERYVSIAGLKADLIECESQWCIKHQIEIFPLARHDTQENLILSQKLYGRDDSINKLSMVFERITEGSSELVLVYGYSGIGKTSIVKEIYPYIAKHQGYFVSGKFDLLHRSTPYSAFIAGFQELTRHLLMESEENLLQLKENILAALGSNGQIIIDVIPNIELIIGPQPKVPLLGLLESKNRFILTLQKFIRAIAQANHPLVIFLDDLQWVDNASLELLEVLINDKELKYFLLIGSYRDNEVLDNHPLMLMLKNFKKSGRSYQTIPLLPLNEKSIQQLLADSLNEHSDRIVALAKLIKDKTEGNPYFINEFLKKLYQDNLLKFSHHDCKWQWDINKIQQLDITDNVIDLLITRIHQLPDNTQKILQLAACIGHLFDMNTLHLISEKSLWELAQSIQQASAENFIIPLNHTSHLLEGIATQAITHLPETFSYRFIHDRVQQAAYQLIPAAEKTRLHLHIGRLLIKDTILEENDDRLFSVLNHFNQIIDLLDDPEERKRLAKFNLWAGRKARASTAYLAAKQYLKAGLELIKDDAAIKQSNLYFETLKELAISQYLTGEHSAAEITFNQLLTLCRDPLKTIELYKINCEMLSALNKHEEALTLGLKALHSLHISIPFNPNKLHIFWEIIKIKMFIGRRKIQSLTLVPMQSEKYKAASALISQLLNSAFFINQNLFFLLVCTNVRLNLRFGYTESNATSFLAFAHAIIHALHWYQEGMAFTELFNRMKHVCPTTNYDGKINYILGACIDPWRYPLDQCVLTLQKSYIASINVGDLLYSNYCNITIILLSFAMGNTLEETQQYLQNANSLIETTKTNEAKRIIAFWQYYLKTLKDTSFDIHTLNMHERDVLQGKNKTEYGFFYSQAIKLCYFLGEYKTAIELGPKHESYIRHTLGYVSVLEGKFYFALAMIANHQINQAAISHEILKKIRKDLQRWASWCATNYQVYLNFFDAEMARLDHDTDKAMKLYQLCIKNAELNKYQHLVALANERYASFFIDNNFHDIAKIYMVNAYDAYQHWGAKMKVKSLENIYPNYFLKTKVDTLVESYPVDNFSEQFTSIDVLSLLKSTQVISSEIQLDKLLQKLLIVLIQNAGAQRAVLLGLENNEWFVQAEGTTAAQRITLTQTEKMQHRTDLPLSLIRYVQRTHESILVKSQEDLKKFIAEDSYLEQISPQSALVMPIFYKNSFYGMLYLENRTNSYAFTPERIHTLQVLSSQAAISLENARLYYQATHDPLTGLANRNLLYQTFEVARTKIKANKSLIAILFLDLDNFKRINDTLGHEIGDYVLQYFANHLKLCLREEDLAIRLGGDEFVVMLNNVDVKQITYIATKILTRLNGPAEIQGHQILIQTSIGISLYPDNSSTIAELLNQADICLYRVKASGKGHYQFYTLNLDRELKQEYIEENDLRYAIEEKQFVLYYQPVYTPSDHHLLYFEALVRWQHPHKGLLSAKRFISLAEETELILPLGEWVIKSIIKQIKSWIDKGLHPVPIAINISGVQLKKQMVSELVKNELFHNPIPPEYLEFELTESIFIDHTPNTLDNINELKKLGTLLTLDDFGTQYSTLSYLRQFSIDKIKIDQSFVRDITHDKKDRELIIAIISMAHSLNLEVITEGVETRKQLEFLVEQGVDGVQGYYLGAPVDVMTCTQLLIKETSVPPH